MDRDGAAIIGLLALIAVIIIFGPLATIWSLNTLFSLGIPYSFWTWLAVLWLGFTINGSKLKSKGE